MEITVTNFNDVLFDDIKISDFFQNKTFIYSCIHLPVTF